MTPVTFSCEALLSSAPEEIAAQILDLSNWPEFQGSGPLPGIHAAEFGVRTPEVVGTRIRVTETTGSQHIEEIVARRPQEHLQIDLSEFAPPLSWLATHFEEPRDLAPTPAAGLPVEFAPDAAKPVLPAPANCTTFPPSLVSDLCVFRSHRRRTPRCAACCCSAP